MYNKRVHCSVIELESSLINSRAMANMTAKWKTVRIRELFNSIIELSNSTRKLSNSIRDYFN